MEDASAAAEPKVFQFTSLSGGDVEIQIQLSGKTYRLRKTRQDKLILTK